MIEQSISKTRAFIDDTLVQMRKVIVGQEVLLRRLLTALLADGHILLEGVPGLAKTLTLRTLTKVLGTSFKRIQFTPDLLPADLTGTKIYDSKNGKFETVQGPVFANFVLADEINRAPAKVQSALLEAMQEKQVTIGGESIPLPFPFFVMATQNPIETEGTYPLPEAQVDRFMLKLVITYPSKEEEMIILDRMASSEIPAISVVSNPELILEIQKEVREVHLEPKLKGYIADLIQATRNPSAFNLNFKNWIQYGASPRGTLFLALSAKAEAYLKKRDYVLPEDIKELAPDVLRHRIILSYEALAEEIKTEDLISKILQSVAVP
jgi:MoxR-like ATPase